jgi:hypothetical protein
MRNEKSAPECGSLNFQTRLEFISLGQASRKPRAESIHSALKPFFRKRVMAQTFLLVLFEPSGGHDRRNASVMF